jgi:hypothetical protein
VLGSAVPKAGMAFGHNDLPILYTLVPHPTDFPKAAAHEAVKLPIWRSRY